MKHLNYCLLGLAFFASSCEKDVVDSIVIIDPVIKVEAKLTDSISFKIDGVNFVGGETRSSGIGNFQTNLKSYSAQIPNRSFAISTGGLYWYGDVDSVYYSAQHDVSVGDGTAKVVFAKKLHKNQLEGLDGTIKYFKNNADFFKAGTRPFAFDYEMESTSNGFVLQFRDNGKFKTRLTSSRPGSSILIRPDIGLDLQKDSKFEIVKATKVKEDLIFIEAKFEMNLYDENGKKYKVTDGFYRKSIRSSLSKNGEYPFYFSW